MKSLLTSFLVILSFSVFAQFSGYFDPANWVEANTGCANGSVDASGAPASVTITGAEVPGGCGESLITYSISTEACGSICFDWNFTTLDCQGAFWDPFGYMVNGVATQLTDNGGANNQSGTTCVTVASGDEFSFYIYSRDTYCGSASVTVSNFSGPDALCHDQHGNPKVEMCHNGHSICVAPAAVPAHLAHGDVLGNCCGTEGLQMVEEDHEAIESIQQVIIAPRTTAAEKLQLLISQNQARPMTAIQVYPNPASDEAHISFNRMEGPVDISIYNLAGQIVFQSTVNAVRGITVPINISELTNGVYNIKLLPRNGNVLTEKLIVDRSKN